MFSTTIKDYIKAITKDQVSFLYISRIGPKMWFTSIKNRGESHSVYVCEDLGASITSTVQYYTTRCIYPRSSGEPPPIDNNSKAYQILEPWMLQGTNSSRYLEINYDHVRSKWVVRSGDISTRMSAWAIDDDLETAIISSVRSHIDNDLFRAIINAVPTKKYTNRKFLY